MPLVPFQELIAEAERGNYAVGYFESWNLESLLAVCDAAEALRSPVILGWSGIFLPHPGRAVRDPLPLYAALGLEACRTLSVPACLLFNESPSYEAVQAAIRQRYSLVMYSDEEIDCETQVQRVSSLAKEAHASGVTIEGEAAALAGVGGELEAIPVDLRLTSPQTAREFVARTGVDALAVNIGQAHLHGRGETRLDFARLEELHSAVNVPLVLHGATSVNRDDLARAARSGIRKINVGSILKQTYFEALRHACSAVPPDANPYETIGSGLADDVLVAGRRAMQQCVEELMQLFGSAGQAIS